MFDSNIYKHKGYLFSTQLSNSYINFPVVPSTPPFGSSSFEYKYSRRYNIISKYNKTGDYIFKTFYIISLFNKHYSGKLCALKTCLS